MRKVTEGIEQEVLARYGPQPMGAEGAAVIASVEARVGCSSELAAAERQVPAFSINTRLACTPTPTYTHAHVHALVVRINIIFVVCITGWCVQASTFAKIDELRQLLEEAAAGLRCGNILCVRACI
jgi:hypothetical protein